jgi:hypothetical protein
VPLPQRCRVGIHLDRTRASEALLQERTKWQLPPLRLV